MVIFEKNNLALKIKEKNNLALVSVRKSINFGNKYSCRDMAGNKNTMLSLACK